MKLIGDNIARKSLRLAADPAREDLGVIRESFVLTAEARQIFIRLAAALFSPSSRPPRPILFVGERGTGKTHLLRYFESLCANPQDPKWRELGISATHAEDPQRRPITRYMAVPPQPEIDLAGFLCEEIAAPGSSDRSPKTPERVSTAEFGARIMNRAVDAFSASTGMLVVDGMSRRISTLVDENRIRREIEISRVLAESATQARVLPVIVIDEEHLRQGPERPTFASFADLKAVCETCRLSRKQIEEVISSTLAAKSSEQRTEILKIVNYLIERLPCLTSEPETFVDLYPLHPLAFNILFALPMVLPGFSPLRFAQVAIESASSRSGAHLITHETLFDIVLSGLRSSPECAPYLRSFDALFTTAISHLKTPLQSKARALLKGIALDTICDTKPPSVRTLADSLLLYDESQPLPGYSLAAAVLLEMEDRGRSFLEGAGDGFERTYRLLGQQMHAVACAVPGRDTQKDDLRLRISQLIYDWFRTEVPAWKLSPDPKYWRMSLSIVAPIPEGPHRSVGMVHFKNIQDPFWSTDDLQNLRESTHSWILLVLGPFEHFYEFESEIANIAASSPKMLVWRPDSPTPAEAEQLRQLAVEYARPAAGAEVAGKPVKTSTDEAHAVLRTLYLKRGRFIAGRGRTFPGEEIGSQTLSQYLSRRLASVSADSLAAALLDEAQAGETAPVAQYDEESSALTWAALLSGEDDLRRLDLQSAETRLIAWWLSVQEIDASALAAKLNPLPDIFMTTRFWGEYRQFVRHLELLQPTFQLLRTKAISLCEAMTQIRLQFNRDENVLRRWKLLNVELAGLARWRPALEHMCEYLQGAFLTSTGEIDSLRIELLDTIAQPHLFMNSGNRDTFDRNFLKFKRQYIQCYSSIHEAVMQPGAEGRKNELKVDPGTLHNLELLSRLQHADKSYVSRVHVIARWFQGNQCTLAVRQILERSPRCYCNFNPGAESNMRMAADRVNSLVEQGLAYFRFALMKCRDLVIEELKRMRVDQACAQQIAPLLGDGSMIPLTSRAIEVLNQMIAKHPQPFMTAFLARKT